MAERYDAAILGAGADGLAAAALLARAGLRVVAVTSDSKPGGRLATREFHPGFFASSFADDEPEIPPDLFWTLELARHGAVGMPLRSPAALAERQIVLPGEASRRLRAEADRRRSLHLAYAQAVRPAPAGWRWGKKPEPPPWPHESWCWLPLAGAILEHLPEGLEAALGVATALSGRAANPYTGGSALHLLAPPEGGIAWRGGLGGLGGALAAAALVAGAEIATGLEVAEIALQRGRARALVLANGTELRARAIVSTLDARQTLMRLLPGGLDDDAQRRRVANIRMRGATARLLLALQAHPVVPETLRGCRIHLSNSTNAIAAAYASWLRDEIPAEPPVSMFVPSAIDPALAPEGAAVVTLTAGCIPHSPGGGHWSNADRDLLRDRLLGILEQALPGTLDRMKAAVLIVPPDIERELGATRGDLLGGEIAPDQMFALRPFAAAQSPYTPVAGLYLAGPSSSAGPLATGVSGAIAAKALSDDLREGRLP